MLALLHKFNTGTIQSSVISRILDLLLCCSQAV